jgi:GT2 family glycosyltransferase
MNIQLSKLKFAAFIMTYERSHLIDETVQKLLDQTFPPEKILIIDNSLTVQTERWFNQKENKEKLEYYRVGKNIGPAGAAKIGLEQLASQGFDWIYWGDDDDPPFFSDTFEILVRMAEGLPDAGCVGAVGHWFDRKTGIIQRVPDAELSKPGTIQVDNIAGNMSKLIRAEAVRKSILPDDQLFFGLEELDFDLKLSKAGFNLYCDRNLYLRYRTESGRIGVKTKRGLKKDKSRLQRDYYSIRNEFYILFKNRCYRAWLFHLLRTCFKIIQGYRFGIKYGSKQSNYLFKAIAHYFTGKKGRYQVE